MSWIEKSLEEIKEGRRKYGLRQYGRRRLKFHWQKVFQPLNRRKIAVHLENLGLKKGDLVCVHSRFSALGYVEGGPSTFIRALEDVVGSTGTILMPTFSTTGSMLSYIESGSIFDVRNTPSRVGILTEIFRTYPGVKRSLHPTNSVAARGALAEALLDGHEKSITPYGRTTPYGKLGLLGGKILMVHTHVLSFLHHLQESVDFPNLYLNGDRQVKYIDWDGMEHAMTTRVMRPRIPYYVILPGTLVRKQDFMLIQDFALIFPEKREDTIIRAGYPLSLHPTIANRREILIRAGVFKAENLGSGRVGLVDVKGFLKIVKPELEDLLQRFRDAYDPEIIDSQNLPYF